MPHRRHFFDVLTVHICGPWLGEFGALYAASFGNCLASHIHIMRTPHFVVLTSVLFGLHHISCILQEGLAEENNFLTFIQTLADFFHDIFSIVGTGYFGGVPGTWLYGTGYRP